MRKKKLALLSAVTLISLVACSSGQQGVSQPMSTLVPTASPQLTATALAKQAPLLATLAAKGDFRWNINLIQDNVTIEAQNNEFKLRRKPFTLRIEVSKPIQVFLNVLDTDSNFVKIHAGLYANDSCVHGIYSFCDFGGMAIVTGPNELVIDKEYEEGIHRFGLDPRLDELGSQFTITSDSIVYERYVSQLTLLTPSQQTDTGAKTTITKIPLEQFMGEKLYLVFLAKHRDENIISDDELRKLAIVFQQ
jgi:hypothetical protein